MKITDSISQLVGNSLIIADKLCDYTPFLSTFTNLVVDKLQKNYYLSHEKEYDKKVHVYRHYIETKSENRIDTAAIPFYGNGKVFAQDLIRAYRALFPKKENIQEELFTEDDLTSIANSDSANTQISEPTPSSSPSSSSSSVVDISLEPNAPTFPALSDEKESSTSDEKESATVLFANDVLPDDEGAESIDEDSSSRSSSFSSISSDSDIPFLDEDRWDLFLEEINRVSFAPTSTFALNHHPYSFISPDDYEDKSKKMTADRKFKEALLVVSLFSTENESISGVMHLDDKTYTQRPITQLANFYLSQSKTLKPNNILALEIWDENKAIVSAIIGIRSYLNRNTIGLLPLESEEVKTRRDLAKVATLSPDIQKTGLFLAALEIARHTPFSNNSSEEFIVFVTQTLQALKKQINYLPTQEDLDFLFSDNLLEAINRDSTLMF